MLETTVSSHRRRLPTGQEKNRNNYLRIITGELVHKYPSKCFQICTYILYKKDRYLIYPVRRLSVLTVIRSTHIQKTGKSNGIEMFDSNKNK